MPFYLSGEVKRGFLLSRFPAGFFGLIALIIESIQKDGFQLITDVITPVVFFSILFLGIAFARGEPAETGELWEDWTREGESPHYPTGRKRRITAQDVLSYGMLGFFILIGILTIVILYFEERAVAGIN